VLGSSELWGIDGAAFLKVVFSPAAPDRATRTNSPDIETQDRRRTPWSGPTRGSNAPGRSKARNSHPVCGSRHGDRATASRGGQSPNCSRAAAERSCAPGPAVRVWRSNCAPALARSSAGHSATDGSARTRAHVHRRCDSSPAAKAAPAPAGRHWNWKAREFSFGFGDSCSGTCC
jgi:hypothetical protein